MRSRSAAVSLVALGLFGLGAFSAREAHADSSCATDADCVKGWACQVTGGSGCGYACPPGQECSPPPDCVPQQTKSCVPGPCKADSDCATGMVCYSTTVGCDAVPPCAAGADCPTTTCSNATQSQCIPRYDAPCTADADCGPGFTCLADSSGCGCASAGSAPGADGGAPPPPVTTCDCPAATTSSCHALPVSCTSAADCASGWSCEQLPSDVTCASTAPAPTPAPPAHGSAGAGGTPAQDAGVDPCPPPAPPMKLCIPPYFSLGGRSLGIPAQGDAPTGTTGSTGAPVNAGTTSPPATPTTEDTASNGQTATASGCSVAFGSNAGNGARGLALLVLGLFGLRRRRTTQLAR